MSEPRKYPGDGVETHLVLGPEYVRQGLDVETRKREVSDALAGTLGRI